MSSNFHWDDSTLGSHQIDGDIGGNGFQSIGSVRQCFSMLLSWYGLVQVHCRSIADTHLEHDQLLGDCRILFHVSHSRRVLIESSSTVRSGRPQHLGAQVIDGLWPELIFELVEVSFSQMMIDDESDWCQQLLQIDQVLPVQVRSVTFLQQSVRFVLRALVMATVLKVTIATGSRWWRAVTMVVGRIRRFRATTRLEGHGSVGVQPRAALHWRFRPLIIAGLVFGRRMVAWRFESISDGCRLDHTPPLSVHWWGHIVWRILSFCKEYNSLCFTTALKRS